MCLIVVPHLPTPEDRLEAAVAHRLFQDLVHPIAQLGVLGRQQTHVVARADIRRLIRQSRVAPNTALGQHLIEQHRVDASDRQIAVRVHIVFVGHQHDIVLGLRGCEDVEGERGAERGHSTTTQVGERAKPWSVRGAHGEDLSKLVVRNRDGESRPASGAVLETAQRDIEITACD